MDDPVVRSEYEFGPEFEAAVIAVMIKDVSFYPKFQPVVSPTLFKDKGHRLIARVMEEHYDQYSGVPSHAVLVERVRGSMSPDAGSAVAKLDSLPDVWDSAYVGDRIIQFAKWTAIDTTLSNPMLRVDPRSFSIEVDKASRVGDSLLLDHTTLDADKDGETAQNELIETPWTWLNERMGGGPEVGDFCCVITVINGGKTTILCNVARHHLAIGKHVVYFTFEDGETKIKRRMLQTIAGWTKEQVVNDLEGARDLRERFLVATGGKMHIKQLKTRRSSVDDAMAFVKAVADKEGRAVDTVITDYADRFKPEGRYNEPRHALREIYEDCKYMAVDLKVQHWSASQSNKLKMGKDVVGMEDGSESTGKFESCDLALGFGQTMEDQKLGKITMFTSKVRDARKNEICPLIADWDVQRIYGPQDEYLKVKRVGTGRFR